MLYAWRPLGPKNWREKVLMGTWEQYFWRQLTWPGKILPPFIFWGPLSIFCQLVKTFTFHILQAGHCGGRGRCGCTRRGGGSYVAARSRRTLRTGGQPIPLLTSRSYLLDYLLHTTWLKNHLWVDLNVGAVIFGAHFYSKVFLVFPFGHREGHFQRTQNLVLHTWGDFGHPENGTSIAQTENTFHIKCAPKKYIPHLRININIIFWNKFLLSSRSTRLKERNFCSCLKS